MSKKFRSRRLLLSRFLWGNLLLMNLFSLVAAVAVHHLVLANMGWASAMTISGHHSMIYDVQMFGVFAFTWFLSLNFYLLGMGLYFGRILLPRKQIR